MQPAPADPSVLHTAGSVPDFLKTVDAGEHWVRLEGPPGQIEERSTSIRAIRTWLERTFPDEIAVDPHDPGTVYAATDAGVFRDE